MGHKYSHHFRKELKTDKVNDRKFISISRSVGIASDDKKISMALKKECFISSDGKSGNIPGYNFVYGDNNRKKGLL